MAREVDGSGSPFPPLSATKANRLLSPSLRPSIRRQIEPGPRRAGHGRGEAGIMFLSGGRCPALLGAGSVIGNSRGCLSEGMMLRSFCGLIAFAALASTTGCGGMGASAQAPVNGSNQPDATARGAAAAGPRFVQVVIFENESYDDVIGSAQAPYITGLSKTWANMTQSFALTHPSEPNYLGLFSGATQGITGDNCPCRSPSPTSQAN